MALAVVLLAGLAHVVDGVALAPKASADEVVPAVTEGEASAAARKSGKPVEVLSFRGESREVFAQPAGGFVATEHQRPVRTVKNGKWVNADATLQKAPDGAIVPVASPLKVRLSGGNDAEMLSMTRGSRRMGLSWPGTLPVPVLEGDTAVYTAVMGPDVDLRVRAEVDRVSFVLVVKTPEAARDPRLATLRFALSAPGLEVSADERGHQRAIDAVTGAEVFSAPPPKMWDSSAADTTESASSTEPRARNLSPSQLTKLAAAPQDTSQLARVDVDVANGAMTLKPDQEMLTAPETTFPVFVDPSYDTPGESARLMVSSGGWEAPNFTGDEGMGRCPISLPNGARDCKTSHVKRLFYRMPTSKFVGKEIISAEFQVEETYAPSCSGRSVRIYRTTAFGSTSTWNSTSDNWAEHITSRDVAKGWSSDCPDGDVIFNVVGAVRDAARYGWSATSFGLRAYDEDDQYAWKRFSANAYLRVHYNAPPPQPKTSQLVSDPGGECVSWENPKMTNRAPTLSANNLTDPDRSGVEGEKLSVEFYVGWTDSGGVARGWSPPAGTVKKASASGSHKSTFSVQIPQDVLPQHTVVHWQVRAYDGRAWSPWSYAGNQTSCYFIYDPAAPPPPVVTSTAADGYLELNPADEAAVPQNGVGRYGKFDVTFDADVAKYAYAINTTPSLASATTRTATTESIWAAPARSGVNILHVKAWDAAENPSAIAIYKFWVTEGAPEKAHWKLDDPAGSGELRDSALKGDGEASYPAATSGTLTLGDAGLVGTAGKLTGTGYATTSGKVLDTTKSFSVSAWAKLSSKDTIPVIAGQEGTRGSSFGLYYTVNRKRWVFNMQNPDTDTPTLIAAESTADATINQWTHLAGVYDHVTKQISLYVNGKLQGAPVSQPNAFTANGPFTIGRFKYKGGYSSDHYFTGSLDDIHVYDRIISSDEVRTLYTIKSEIVGRWRLNTASGTPLTSADSAPVVTKHPVTLAGAAAISTDPAKAVVMPADGAAGALDLPGGNGDYASANAAVVDTADSFTVSAWAQTAGTPANSMTVLSLGGTANSAIVVRYDATKGHYVLDIPDEDKAGASFVSVEHSAFHEGGLNDWDHIAVVFDGFNSRITLYVNGMAQEAAESPTVSFRERTRVFAPVSSLQLGSARSGGSYPDVQNWSGQIDDVWVLRGVASEDEILYLSNPAVELDIL
ncbi:LamG-like jellyroll fold domain-containing protein [Actinomadura sp. HBU206391]|uniref:LamG-like jellyroll fold domain-containing protein n=1 Tax=Actinomadura sp. HBU206391 TaxID=2731692 RepID=UPI00164F9050|nr:LamG-like jellyroll fold domain-containing protein [Actinomadura sp. HBU206391]MBC6460372.1 LamG domain-containing protein [Actinomadura sp. HBU206391]